MAIIQTVFTEKHVKVKNDPKFDRGSNSALKLLTFQLSNVIELETIKYAFARNSYQS